MSSYLKAVINSEVFDTIHMRNRQEITDEVIKSSSNRMLFNSHPDFFARLLRRVLPRVECTKGSGKIRITETQYKSYGQIIPTTIRTIREYMKKLLKYLMYEMQEKLLRKF